MQPQISRRDRRKNPTEKPTFPDSFLHLSLHTDMFMQRHGAAALPAGRSHTGRAHRGAVASAFSLFLDEAWAGLTHVEKIMAS